MNNIQEKQQIITEKIICSYCKNEIDKTKYYWKVRNQVDISNESEVIDQEFYFCSKKGLNNFPFED